MRVLLAGDTHGSHSQIRYLLDTAVDKGVERIIQVGDFGFWPHLEDFHVQVNRAAMKAGIDFYWLDGNHENFDALEAEVDVDANEPQQMLANLWYLPRGSTWEWDGCRFMALGGAFSIDKDDRTRGYSWWHQEIITYEQVDRACERGPVDVLLTHDAPEGTCPIIRPGYKYDEMSRGNRLAVSAVMEAVKPKLLVHGHYHHRYSGERDGVQVEGLDRDGMWEHSWIGIDTDHWREP